MQLIRSNEPCMAFDKHQIISPQKETAAMTPAALNPGDHSDIYQRVNISDVFSALAAYRT
jgi:hypothetical protein